jgi:hypothetical protein
MSLNLDAVSQVVCEGEVNPGNKAKVVRLETKRSNWYHNIVEKVINKYGSKKRTREAMFVDLLQVENRMEEYWCEGKKCVSNCIHWVLHSSKMICRKYRYDPCACSSPLVWDESEHAYYRFFLSCDGKTKENIWMLEPPNG